MRFIAVCAALALGLVLTGGAAVARPLDKGPAGSIYSVRDNGTDRRLVVQPQIRARRFVRSPRGRSIAYVQEVDGVQALFAADVSGANRVRLTPPNVTAFWGDVAFSPNGRRIAFSAIEPVGSVGYWRRAGVYVVGRNGDNLRFLANGSNSPSWAPDGRRVAWDAPRGIVVADLQSGERTVVSTFAAGLPLWSPRGDRIAYQMRSATAYPSACTVAPDGSRRHCIHGRSFKWLVWAPDGRRLAFKQVRPARLGIMDAYGRHIQRSRKIDRTAYPVAWSPDGTRLAYSFGPYHDAVRVKRVDGPQRTAVRVAYEPGIRLTDIRWRGHRISYIAG